MTSQKAIVWSRDRLGLLMIGASLLVIAISASLLATHSRNTRESQIRAQGISLIRVLSAMPISELIPDSRPEAILNALQLSKNSDDFAYATIMNANGAPLAEVAASGVLIPEAMVPAKPSAWLGASEFPLGANRQAIIEFHAPLLVGGEIAAYLRLGYFKPGIGLNLSQLPLFATLALLIFMLTPFFYYLLRKEIRPLDEVSANLSKIIENGSLATVEVSASGELGQFMAKFNRFVDLANSRINQVQSEHDRAIASTKLLSYRKERIVSVLESIPDAILVLDDGGNITVANSKLEAVLGVTPETVTGSDSLDWCTQAEVRNFISNCQAGDNKHALPAPIEFSPELAPTKNMELSAYPLFLPDGSRSIGSLVVIRDITVEVLARTSRAAFVAQVAHELKTPLHVLSMYSEALQGAEPGDEELRIEASNVIYDEVARLSQLINNMLSISKIEMGSMGIQRQRVKVPDLLLDVVSTIKHTRAAEDLEFETNIPAEMAAQQLDKDLLRVALNNLLSNSVKYNRPGGKVIVSAEEDQDVLRIRVSDTGIGIAEQDLPKVFDRYFRSDSEEVTAKAGHGLGLALTKDIVELHNGSITARSVVGKGTEFIIELWKYDAKIEKAG